MKEKKQLPLKEQIIIFSSIGLIFLGLSLLTSNLKHNDNKSEINSVSKESAESCVRTFVDSWPYTNTINSLSCTRKPDNLMFSNSSGQTESVAADGYLCILNNTTTNPKLKGNETDTSKYFITYNSKKGIAILFNVYSNEVAPAQMFSCETGEQIHE